MRTQRYVATAALALVGIVGAPALPGAPGASDTRRKREAEQKLVAVLRSDAPLFRKARACQQLAVVGGRNAVGALAALLDDASLGDYARLGLEPIDDPSVDEALRQAMGRLEGRLLAGVVNSIGVRRDAKAVEGLRKLVREPGRGVASEALAALGRIATDEAIETIRQVLAEGPATLRTAAADACLTAAERLSARGKQAEAVRLYDAVRKADVPGHVRASATRSAILARGTAGLTLLLEQLETKDPAMVGVALRAARELPGPAVSEKLTAALGKVRPDVQALLIGVLVDRKAATAREEIAALAAGGTSRVRLASLKALGKIGDASAVAVLVRAAGAGGTEGAAARASLRTLDAPGADAAILAGMKAAEGERRVELIDVLADRRCVAATAALLREAARDDADVAKAAFQALGVLAKPKDLPAMVKLLLAAGGRAAGSEAENAVVLVSARIADAARRADAVLAAVASAGRPAQRASLVRVLGRIGGAKAYEAVAAALGDADADVNDAAVRAVSAWPDARAAQVLLDLSRNAANDTHRVLALRGYVRLLGLAKDRHPRQTVRKYADVLAAARRGDSKKLILAGLANVAHGDALDLAMAHLGDAGVRSEAASAAVKIARAIMGADRQAARAAMEKVLAVAKNKRVAAEARQIIRQIDRFADSITAWRVAGPYAARGKRYDQLFDVAFEPEKPRAKGVAWRPLAAGTDPKRPWLLDLLRAVGGTQRVAYALTWVHSDTAQPARLELGTDDGVKAWLNGRLVHANNTARAATPYTDRADVSLKAGWNPLLLKITQNNLTWEFCARLCRRDGRKLEGVRIDAAHEGDWTLPAASAAPRPVEPGGPAKPNGSSSP